MCLSSPSFFFYFLLLDEDVIEPGVETTGLGDLVVAVDSITGSEAIVIPVLLLLKSE